MEEQGEWAGRHLLTTMEAISLQEAIQNFKAHNFFALHVRLKQNYHCLDIDLVDGIVQIYTWKDHDQGSPIPLEKEIYGSIIEFERAYGVRP